MNNDWHEKGELPPSNTGCEVRIDGQWLPTVVIGHYANEAVVVDPCVTVQRFFCTTVNNLRPLRTETDKLIEQMMFHGCQSLTKKQATELVEQGYRKVKPMSEDEFVQASLKSFESKCFEVSRLKFVCESLRKLHKVGCRFIDQGE